MTRATVTVRLFGLMSAYGGPRTFEIETDTIRDALIQLESIGVDKNHLKRALIFVNGQHLKNARSRLLLKDGYELALLSPAGGG